MKTTALVLIGILLLVTGFALASFVGGESIANAILTMIYPIFVNVLPNVHILQIISAITMELVCIISGGILVTFGLLKKERVDEKKPLFDGKKTKVIWIATEIEIDKKDFEETRRCLLNSYHSYVQTHAGYIIALIIGLFALVSTFKSFIDYHLWGIGVFCFLIILIVIASAFTGLRIVYWSIWASTTITITIANAISLFNEYNETEGVYQAKAPNTQIIQIGIKRALQKVLGEGDFPFWKKWAIKTARKSFPGALNLKNELNKR